MRRGAVSVELAGIVLVGVLLLMLCMESIHVYAAVQKVREKTDEAVLAAASANVAEFFGGARESDGTARHPEGGGFASSVVIDTVRSDLAAALGGEMGADGTIFADETTISEVNTVYENADDGVLCFRTSLTVTVPISIGGFLIPEVERHLTVLSTWDAKF